MLRKIYTTLTFLLLFQVALFAQDESKVSGLYKSGKNYYESFQYGPAIKVFEQVLKNHPDYTNAVAMLADSYRKVQDYKNAATWYQKLTATANIKPEWALQYAEVLANNGQYKASGEWYAKYSAMVNGNRMADGFAKLYANVDPLLAQANQWKIEYLNINTAASEFSPTYYKGGLTFTSNRKVKSLSKNVFEWNETPFTDIYYVKTLAEVKAVNLDSLKQALRAELKKSGKKLYRENDDDTYQTSNDSKIVGSYAIKLNQDTVGDYLAKLVDVQPIPGKINTKYHDGPAAILPGDGIIFNRNNYFEGKYSKSTEGVNKLKLFTAAAPDYTKITAFPYNNDQYSVGHPTVNSAGTLLIFASDMPGGSGKSDLYYSKRASVSDEWGKPVNLGTAVNTEGVEQFPTLYKDNELYFASSGLPGLGGLDIFKVSINADGTVTGTPVNLGAPINSSVDDFGLIKNDAGTAGYFTSNRKGSDDIYSFGKNAFQIKLNGLVVDAGNNAPVANASVGLKATSDQNFKTSTNGKFESLLTKDLTYNISISKDGYESTSASFNTTNIVSDTVLNVVVKLTKKAPVATPPAAVTTTPAVTGGPVVATPGFDCDEAKAAFAIRKIYYDLDKSLIRADAGPALDQLIDILKNHPEVNIVLASYTDIRATKAYNIALSKRRSISARAYLLEHGISSSRIKIEYFGETHLVNKCADGVKCTEAEHQLNRRTEFIMVGDGKQLHALDCNDLAKYFDKK